MAFFNTTFSVGSTVVEQPFTREIIGFEPGNVYLSVESQNIRYWYSGADPTTTSGHLLFANQGIIFSKPSEILQLKLIAIAGTAIVQATVEGR